LRLDDSRGLAVTAASRATVDHYDATLASYLRFRRDTGDHLKATLASDADFALGHATRGYFMMLFETRAFQERARHSLAAAAAALEKRPATPRERAHVDALRAWVVNDLEGAVRRWDAIAIEHPRDALALKLAQYGLFYLGDAAGMRDSLARAWHAWDENVPGYGYMLGSYAFAHEESGDYAAAERTGKRAVELDPADVWAAHAVAHVMEMQGRHRDGTAWLGGLDRNWGDCHNFVFHILWHRALLHFDLGEYDRVLALYDAEVRKESTDEYLDITNAVALLWRLELAGIEVGGRWSELAERSASHIDDHLLVFADVHYAMALATVGGADAMIAAARHFAATGDGTEAAVMRDVGLALSEAAVAWRAGDYGRVVDLIWPVRGRIRRIGGSHAQRDLFEQTLLTAALRAGRLPLARALVSERLEKKPASPWNRRAAAQLAEVERLAS
jgi:tetratricopeptide (TPR) repeat protein